MEICRVVLVIILVNLNDKNAEYVLLHKTYAGQPTPSSTMWVSCRAFFVALVYDGNTQRTSSEGN